MLMRSKVDHKYVTDSGPPSSLFFVWGALFLIQIVMWMQQGRICILGKIEFSIDNENAGKNAQVKLYFMTELKVILYLWKK